MASDVVLDQLVPSKINSIIFDLDGTIIDSQLSIIESLKWTLKNAGIESVVDINRSLIGPPLVETLKKVTGRSDVLLLGELISSFKSRYDSFGYKSGKPYLGMESAIRQLHNKGFELHVATNKRLIPTQNIMKYFSLGNYFKSLYSIDLNIGSPFQNKTQMIGELVMDYKIDPNRALYIGDRVDDYHSAIANNMDCLLVGWGYGAATNELYGHSLVDSPSDLYSRISSF